MKQIIKEIETGIIEIQKDTEKFTGFKISNSSKPDTYAIEKRNNQAPGYLVRSDSVIPWEALGAVENNGRYTIGEFFEGQTLTNVLTNDFNIVAKTLKALIENIITLKKHTAIIPRIQTNAILISSDMDMLFLTGMALNRFRNNHIEHERVNVFDLYNDHKRNDEENLSFSLAVIVYKLLAGKFPYQGDSSGELNQTVGKKHVIPLKNIIPEVDDEISQTIHSCLTGSSISLEKWTQLINKLNDGNWKVDVDEIQSQKLISKGEKIARRFQLYNSVDNFFRNNRFKIILASVIGLFVGSLLYSYISRALEPPVTVGMQPREVVELMYKSMNTFDHLVMEDTITKEAGKAYINEAVNMFAFAKMRESYELGVSPFIDVQKWVDEGRPAIPDDKAVYGIANLSIKEEEMNVFIAEYEKWRIDDSTTSAQNPNRQFIGIKKKERLTLEMKNNAWIITKLEVLSEDRIKD